MRANYVGVPREREGTVDSARPPATADRLVDAFVERFELLAEQPTMSRLRPEFSEDVRSFTVENYVIYYRYEGDV